MAPFTLQIGTLSPKIQGMLRRWLTDPLNKAVAHTPAVALLGPRQVGKTTLAHQICNTHSAIYLDLESPADLFKLNDPVGFLSQHQDKLVILDEIQRTPDLFLLLRGLIDQNRARGRKAAQFLLLGSASMDLLRQSSESLAGRISYVEMTGLNALETPHDKAATDRLWLRGGFPDSYLAHDDQASLTWREHFIRTYLERDIPQMGFRVPAAKLRRLWTMLAHVQGELMNYSRLGSSLEMGHKTVNHYIDILVDLLLVRRLEPWHANVKKRLVKSPRFYIRDSGILHRLLGIDDRNALLSNPILGKSWEGFVIEQIHSILPTQAQTYFYRTAAGAEIDLLIHLASDERWAIEIKHGVTPAVRNSFHQSCQDVQATHKYVVYSGADAFPIGNGITVTSLHKLMQQLQRTPA